jgi:flagellar hook-basal body complex protein FliE
VLVEAIGEVQRLQTEADTTIKSLVAGEIKDVTDAMIAVEKADVAFQTMMAVRNRIVAAYEEIMRMQV